MKILVTDDDPDGGEVTQIMLQRLGHQVALAHNGLETIKQATSDTPEMILLDINLPGMDGYKTCAELRKNPALQNTPIFAYTGLESERAVAEAKAAGFTDVLVKSANFDNVRDKIASLTTGQNNNAPSAGQSAPAATSADKKKEDISKVVHDLRGPLSTLQNCLEIMESGFKKPEDVMPPMRRSVEAMVKLVERLRDINHE